jgi:spore coat polysaccharide biosynthesis protein SpsF
MKSKTRHVLFRCDGSSTIGIGHVMRCVAIADELRRDHGVVSGFALRSDESGARLIQRYNFPVFVPRSTELFDYRSWLCELANETQAGALVLDVRDNLPTSTLEDLRNSDVLLVTVDDPSQRRLHADLAFYPPVPQVDRMDWTEFEGRLFKGWDWIPLRREISEAPARSRPNQVESLLVTTGGADPAGMAVRIVDFLNPLEKPFETVVAAGPAFQHRRELEQAVAVASGDFRIESDPESLPALMTEADLAITSFGVTAYELAAMGVPAAYLCLTPDHQESASVFAGEGLGISLGLISEIDGERFREGLLPLLETSELRHTMCRNGKKTVDGLGAKRISNLIVEHLEKEPRND